MTAQRQAIMQVHQMSIAQFEQQFQDEDDCKSYLANNRWPIKVTCPRCGADATEHGTMEWHWNCYNCTKDGLSYRFSVTVGTIFENTNKPLREWFRVMHLILTSKKGISSLQVMRYMGFGSYNTALKMCNKIRVALSGADFRQLVGVVEIDETFVGGKAKNKHKKDRDQGPHGGAGGKEIIVGAVQRKGNVIARVIADISKETLDGFVNEVVSHKVSLLCTDEHRGYVDLWKLANHRVIAHSAGQYVNGAVHTNTIEGFWSIIKRGIMGTFHKVSRKYLPLYVAEFEFRYNNRMNADIFGAAIKAC